MIDSEYVRRMARYNAWQNRNLFGAAATLNETDRRTDRGAFFGSIHGTLSHILWGDTIWMSRFDGWEKPAVGISGSAAWADTWEALSNGRAEADARILRWAGDADDSDFDGELSWYSGSLGRSVTKPLGLCVVHFFNHQTHHRGQVHAMLTAAGARPEDTDLFVMPDDA